MTTPPILLEEYANAVNTPSDINQHLETLRSLAEEVDHVTEMGVRTGMSTRAFLCADVTLRSYDLFIDNGVAELFRIAREAGKDVRYSQANVLEITIEPTDFLFIDTWHAYEQLRTELMLHAKHVKKYIAFHDTQTFASVSENLGGKVGSNGLLPAIIHHMIDETDWRFKLHRTNNNGLTVIERL